jgi:hypothetical protein
MQARLIRRRWLYRCIEVDLPDGPHVLEYNGWGIGSEKVVIDGHTIRRTSIYWFVPRFDFTLGGRPWVVEVRVWPWFGLRSLVLRVDGKVIYAEGTARMTEKPVHGYDGGDELA